jgi:hypothetical protein
MLLNLMPAAIVLALYAFLLAIPAQRNYRAMRQEFASVQETAVDKEAARQSLKDLQAAEAGVARLNEQIRKDRQQIALLGHQWSNSSDRLSIVQQVTELLQQFNLSILKQEFQEQPPLSDYLQDLERIVIKHAGENETVEYWRIELSGGYPDMLRFLQQVKISGLRTFPLTLTMQASQTGDGIHTWSVVFVV